MQQNNIGDYYIIIFAFQPAKKKTQTKAKTSSIKTRLEYSIISTKQFFLMIGEHWGHRILFMSLDSEEVGDDIAKLHESLIKGVASLLHLGYY